MEKEVIREIIGEMAVILNTKIDIMTIACLYQDKKGYCSGEDDDDYPIIWFVNEQGRIHSAEIVDWRDWGINHIDELSTVISKKTDWPKMPIAKILKSVSEKGKNLKPFWED